MTHLTQEELKNLIDKARSNASSLSQEEQETIKLYIPMQLGEESAKKMMSLVTEIREGKRAPLSEEDRIALNQKNMEESLHNFLANLAKANDEELDSMYEMCETIRSSRTVY